MGRRIAIVQGHPDPAGGHFGHALADAYAAGAAAAGHEVRRVEVARLDFGCLRRPAEWNQGPLPPGLQEAQAAIGWADHLVLVFPLWLGTMPALLKAFLEQVLRPGFAFHLEAGGRWRQALGGRSARLVVTMGMPALLYRWFFLAHGVRGLERNILHFCGIRPVRASFIGLVESRAAARAAWLGRLRELGAKAV
ncbi:MAG: NAD(P)H-dependent oxidoreductase [Opitutaceae bacterium]|nr:NAD(P)H-dependent oxidoreductase [Opitutaceae bacterium]